MRPPVRYPGGKQAVARAIADMLPVHDHYVEPFMGAASVFFAKPPSPIETLNDLDREIFNFFRVLRDRPADLGRVCSLTPYSKAEYEAAVAPLGPAADEVDAARRTWVRLSQGRGSRVSSPSWQNKIQGDFSSPRYLKGYLARMAPCAERL
ncbi:MAG: DNA adenine methylase, partial [Propionibacteriaceae bacterium]|nr:DNA adenine methylase [Propionibacteriaceae bacterium]